jgi:hypothetical protein
MDNQLLREILTLEAIKTTTKNVPFPIGGNWEFLKSEVETLETNGLLSIDSDKYIINDDGKKAILLMKDFRKGSLEALEKFKDFSVGLYKIDARIPVEAFKLRGKDGASEILFNVVMIIIWDEFFSVIKELHRKKQPWQKYLISAFDYDVRRQVDLEAWRKLGRNTKEALLTGKALTSPPKKFDLIKITRGLDNE